MLSVVEVLTLDSLGPFFAIPALLDKKAGAGGGAIRRMRGNGPSARTFPAMSRMSPPVPRLGLTIEEAAEAVGVSESSFKRHVQPELRIVRRGRLRIVPIPEIERWLEGNASFAGSSGPSRLAQTRKRPRAVGAAGGMAQGDTAP